MFTSGMKESEQDYCEFNEDATVVEQCIEFMYEPTGKMDLHPETVVKILKLSHQWLLHGAVTKCWKYMQDKVSNENCVEWINLSKLYQLQELESTCMVFLLQNLSDVENIYQLVLQTLQSLINKAKERPEHAKVMWNIIKARIQQRDCDIPCTLIQSFHVEGLTKPEYQSSVLKDNHVSSCRPCNDYLKQRRQAHAYKIEDVKVENCLAVKYQTTKYDATGILQALDKFIIKKFRQICKRKEFLKLVTEEHLLKYICSIERQCTHEELERIIQWFRSNSKRDSSFPKIFLEGTGTCSQFKHCLQTLTKRNNETLLSDVSNCCYLRYLAEKYSCEKILVETEYFIHWNFEDAASCPDIAYLSVKTMESFAGTESLCFPNEGWTMWRAVRLWGQNKERSSKDEFSRVFCSILLGKFSISSLQTICNDPLVKKSAECCSKLLEVGLSKMSENRSLQDKHHSLFISRMSNFDAQIEQFKNQYEQVDERNFKSWQNLKKLYDEIAATEHCHWQNLNQRNKAIQQSISRMEENIESVTDELKQFKNQYEQVDERNRKRWQDLKKQTDKLEATEYFNSQNSNQENRATQQSISRVEENIEESVANLTERLDELQRENKALRQGIESVTRQQSEIQYKTMNFLESIREEHNEFKKRAISVLIGGVILYFCYKVIIRNDRHHLQ